MSVRFIHKISAILLAAGLLSCGREDSCILGSPDAISLGPGLETRTAITGTTMPDGFHIWLSAWYSDESNPSLDRNYFTGTEFSKDGSVWKASPAKYWPLAGTLEFLGIAANPGELALGFTWDAGHNTSRVTVSVPDTYDTQSEVLFAAAYPLEGERAPVPMDYRHSQALVRFQVRADVTDVIRIKEIRLRDVYTEGVLTVEGNGPLKASWDFSSATAGDRTVPKSSAGYLMDVPGGYTDFCEGILLPEQPKASFDVIFLQRANISVPWDSPMVIEETFSYLDPVRNWAMGKQYIYKIDFSLTGISVSPDVQDGFI